MHRLAMGLAVLPLLAAGPQQDGKVNIGTGCFYDVLLTTDQIGRQCHADSDPAFAAALTESVARMDAMFAQRGVSAEDIAAIKARNAQEAASCGGEADKFYRIMAQHGAAELRESTDVVVARPGKPTYGDCF